MFLRRCVFMCMAAGVSVSLPGVVAAQSDLGGRASKTANARPTPKPSPTPTIPGDISGVGGGTHDRAGQGALATATPRPAPTPTDPDKGPIGPSPGGPHAQFVGVWTLDKAKSEGLSSRMQGADRVAWIITQDDKTISIDQKIEGGQFPAGGAGVAGGGGGMGGGRPSADPPAYRLDGSESTMEMGQAKSTLKVTWVSNALELSRKSIFAGPNGEVTTSETRKLELSGDGQVLTAKVHTEGPRGAVDMTLVFKKQ